MRPTRLNRARRFDAPGLLSSFGGMAGFLGRGLVWRGCSVFSAGRAGRKSIVRARRRSWGGAARPQGNQRETQGWEVGEKGDRAGKNRTWTDRAKGRKTAGDARRVRPRADRVWGEKLACRRQVRVGAPGGKHMRGEALDRKLRKRAGRRPERQRLLPRLHSIPPPHISPLPAKPLGSIPEKRRAHRGCFSSFRHALCRKALPALLKTPGSHTPLCAPPGPDVLPDSGASAHGGGAGAALGKGKRISYDVMFFQVICFLFPSIRILLCRIR